MTVVIPTLTAGDKLTKCLASLRSQRFRDFEVIIIDNGANKLSGAENVRVLTPETNLGFAGAMQLGIAATASPYVFSLNDDTTVEPECLENLVAAMEADASLGSCAPKIILTSGRLDSAGMAIGRDGASKQRGHLDAPANHSAAKDVLFASGCAALYRRDAIGEAGGFDRDFFLYCEDTDLGLRMQWLGWACRFEPSAIVHHDYSQTSGAASSAKVYYAERNRLAVLTKNFPLDWILVAPLFSALRYWSHIRALRAGSGYAGQSTERVPWVAFLGAIAKASLDWLLWLPRLVRQRRRVQRAARISPANFRSLLRKHSLTAAEIAGV